MMNKTRTILFTLILLFVIPFIAAWLGFTKGYFLTTRHVNQGTLLTPFISLEGLSLTDLNNNPVSQTFHGKWWLIYLTDSQQIDPSLRHNLYYMKQIRQATGKNRDRIEQAILTLPMHQDSRDAWLNKAYPNTHHFQISIDNANQLVRHLPKNLALKKGSLYLVDPLGNIMMFYAPDAAPKGILRDLERVLKVSQIG